jgi:hypothetical protein
VGGLGERLFVRVLANPAAPRSKRKRLDTASSGASWTKTISNSPSVR